MAIRTLVGVLVACVAGMALTAPIAAADARFPKKRITYRDKSSFKPAVAEAARLWNAARTRVKLVPTRSRRANITITTVRSLSTAGRPVAGRGGGVDIGGRRLRGFVKLSRSALTPLAERVRTNVAAHELGHALGLGHARHPCTLMNEYPDDLMQSVCPAGVGRYRCGPQSRDAKALARLYRTRARFPVGAGTCALPRPRVEILGPPSQLTLQPGQMVDFAVRNGGPSTWVRYGFYASFTDARGNEVGHPCSSDGTPIRSPSNEQSVPPGAPVSFPLELCGEPGTTRTFSVRLFDEVSDPGRSFGVGPVHTFTVQFG